MLKTAVCLHLLQSCDEKLFQDEEQNILSLDLHHLLIVGLKLYFKPQPPRMDCTSRQCSGRQATKMGKDSSIQTIYQLSGIVSYLGESIETGLPCDEDSGDSSPEGKRGDGRHFDYFLWIGRSTWVCLAGHVWTVPSTDPGSSHLTAPMLCYFLSHSIYLTPSLALHLPPSLSLSLHTSLHLLSSLHPSLPPPIQLSTTSPILHPFLHPSILPFSSNHIILDTLTHTHTHTHTHTPLNFLYICIDFTMIRHRRLTHISQSINCIC
ncbi:unnamed protein product [Arctogadus glacialis]